MHQEQYNLASKEEYGEQFVKAAASGNVEELKRLLEIPLRIVEKYYMIHYNKDAAFKAAATNGHLEVLKFLVSLKLYYMKMELMTCYGPALTRAASNGHIDIVKYLLEKTFGPQESSVMLFNHSDIISLACKEEVKESNYIKTLGHLLPLILDHDYKMRIVYKIFPIIAESGDVGAMKRILSMIQDPAQKEEILHGNEDQVFREVASNGHLNVMKFLIKKTPDPEKREWMIHCRQDYAFRLATENNHLEVSEYLIKLTPDADKRKLMLCNVPRIILRKISNDIGKELSHIEIWQYLMKWIPDQSMRDMVTNKMYRIFRNLNRKYINLNIKVKIFSFLLKNTSL